MSVELQAAQTVESVIWYGVGVLLAISGALVIIVFKMTQKQAQDNQTSLDQKASNEALKEAKADLQRAIEMHTNDYRERLEMQNTDQRERLNTIEMKQNREIDRLTKDIDALVSGVNELRRDVGSGNLKIMERLGEILARSTQGGSK